MDDRPKIKRSPDDPVSLQKEDALGRWQFAKEIVELIDGTSSWPSSRIGIYGSWGTGKTSVLGFIRTLLEEKDCPVVSFDPWKFHSPDELWASFAYAIDIALSNDSDEVTKTKIQELGQKLLDKAGKSIEEAGGPLAKTIHAIIKGPAKQLLQTGREEIEKKVRELCPQKRLVVLIDDLDRTDSELLPEILMHLRSVLDLDGFIYVLALDPKVVGSALGDLNQEWTDGYSFLEKIIEYPRWLPNPTEEQWKNMLIEETKRLVEWVDQDAILGTFDCLPQNPRKFKQHLRYLSALKSKVARFGENELNLQVLYLAQLLRVEYPDSLPQILGDEDLCHYIRFTSFEGRTGWDNEEKAKEKETNRQERIEAMAPSAPSSKEQFKRLLGGMAERYDLADQNDLDFYFYFTEKEIICTWKEYVGLLDRWENLSDANEQEDLLEPFLTKTKAPFLFKRTIEYRHNILGQVADTFSEEEQCEKLKSADTALEILTFLIKNLNLFNKEDPLLGPDEFYSLLCHARHWSNFKNQNHYDERRKQECQLLSDLVESSKNHHPEFLEKYLRERDPFDEDHKDFDEYKKSLVDLLHKSTSERLLEIFDTPHAFHDLWGENKHIALKRQLLVADSYFHADDFQKRLKESADQANANIGIQENFCDCFRMIAFYTNNPPMATSMDEVKAVVIKTDFVGMIWEAATAKRLNRRVVGTLNEMRSRMIHIANAEAHLPLPKWWSSIMEAK